MKKFFFPISLVALLFLSCHSGKIKAYKHPNIIFVLADDLGYGDIAIYNENSKIKTPHIDKLASEGLMFTDAHTSSSVCTPTRYGILTGRYNWRSTLKAGVLSGTSNALIPANRTTVASLLKRKKYATAFIGKWHLGWDWAQKETKSNDDKSSPSLAIENIDFSKPVRNGPKELGFDYSYGHSGSLDMAPYVYVENGMPTSVPATTTVNTGKYSWWREGPTASDFIHAEVTPHFFKKSFEYIKERSKEQQPFFLYLALPSPHTPILPNKEWQNKSGLNPYADFVMMIDDYMGQLEVVIREAGIEHNTIVIFTSDNGCSPEANFDELEEKGHFPSYTFRGHKADIFEGGHRVPFIVKWPREITKGLVSDQTICTNDFMATCAEIVDYSLSDNEGEDSFSLVSLLKQVKPDKPIREATIHHSIDGSFAIRKGDWKLIMCPGSGGWSFPRPSDTAAIDTLPKYQLYQLKNDPGETINLYATNTEKVNELKSLLVKHITEGRSTPGLPQKNDSINFQWNQIEFINQ